MISDHVEGLSDLSKWQSFSKLKLITTLIASTPLLLAGCGEAPQSKTSDPKNSQWSIVPGFGKESVILRGSAKSEHEPDLEITCFSANQQLSIAYNQKSESRHSLADKPDMPYELFRLSGDTPMMQLDGAEVRFRTARVLSYGSSYTVSYRVDLGDFESTLNQANQFARVVVKNPGSKSYGKEYDIRNLKDKWSEFLTRCRS